MLKTKLQTFKAAMKAPQYEKLSMYELKIYQAGFKNGFKLAHSEFFERVKELKLVIKHLKNKKHPELIKTSNLKKSASSDDMKKVIDWVSKKFKVDQDVITCKSRIADVTKLRSLALNIIHENYDVSTPTMGRFFGMDHTSVLHHLKNKANYKSCWSTKSNLWQHYKEFKF